MSGPVIRIRNPILDTAREKGSLRRDTSTILSAIQILHPNRITAYDEGRFFLGGVRIETRRILRKQMRAMLWLGTGDPAVDIFLVNT